MSSMRHPATHSDTAWMMPPGRVAHALVRYRRLWRVLRLHRDNAGPSTGSADILMLGGADTPAARALDEIPDYRPAQVLVGRAMAQPVMRLAVDWTTPGVARGAAQRSTTPTGP
jgi:hypothetical protein